MTQENPEQKNPAPDGADPVGTADTADTADALDTLKIEDAADPAGARGRPAGRRIFTGPTCEVLEPACATDAMPCPGPLTARRRPGGSHEQSS